MPADAVALHIVALGASGGDTETDEAMAVIFGGYGTKVDMTINVTPGDTLTIVVGDQPQLQVAGTDGCGGSGAAAAQTTLLALAPLLSALPMGTVRPPSHRFSSR